VYFESDFSSRFVIAQNGKVDEKPTFSVALRNVEVGHLRTLAHVYIHPSSAEQSAFFYARALLKETGTGAELSGGAGWTRGHSFPMNSFVNQLHSIAYFLHIFVAEVANFIIVAGVFDAIEGEFPVCEKKKDNVVKSERERGTWMYTRALMKKEKGNRKQKERNVLLGVPSSGWKY
jgi:hypothetical protein